MLRVRSLANCLVSPHLYRRIQSIPTSSLFHQQLLLMLRDEKIIDSINYFKRVKDNTCITHVKFRGHNHYDTCNRTPLIVPLFIHGAFTGLLMQQALSMTVPANMHTIASMKTHYYHRVANRSEGTELIMESRVIRQNRNKVVVRGVMYESLNENTTLLESYGIFKT